MGYPFEPCQIFNHPSELLENLSLSLRHRRRNTVDRHETLLSAIAWSYDHLDVGEKSLFRICSTFSGNFERDGVEQLSRSSPLAPVDLTKKASVVDGLANLLEKNFIFAKSVQGATYFQMLNIVREFGQKKLIEAGEFAALNTSHTHQYSQKLRQWIATHDYKKVDREYDNLRAALKWLLMSLEPKPEAGLELVGQLSAYWLTRGFYTEGRSWLEQFHRATQPYSIPGASRIQALRGYAEITLQQADLTLAQTLFEECQEIYEVTQDHLGLADTHKFLGNIARLQGDLALSDSLYKESLRSYRNVPDLDANMRAREGMARILTNIGLQLQDQMGYVEAAQYHQESLQIFQSLGHDFGVANASLNLGIAFLWMDQHVLAEQHFQTSLDLSQTLQDKDGIAYAYHAFGELKCYQGDLDVAADYNACSLSFWVGESAQEGIAHSLELAAHIHIHQGRLAAATRFLGSANALRLIIQTPLPQNESVRQQEWQLSLQAEMGDIAYTTAWKKGVLTDWREAVSWILSERSTE